MIDVASKRPVKLEVGDTRDQFFSLIGWSKDDREVYLYRMSRDHKRLEVLAGLMGPRPMQEGRWNDASF